jgi:hypothetical protein
MPHTGGESPPFTPFVPRRNIRGVLVYLCRLALLLVAVPSGILVVAAFVHSTDHYHILNYPFPLRLWPIYLSLFALCLGLWMLSMRHADWKVITRPRDWLSCLKERHIVTVLIVAKALIAVWICQQGFLFLTSDDFCRIDVAYRWSDRPFFATWDHVWLAGQFYIQGSLIRLINDPLVSARLSALLFSVLCALVFFRLTRAVFDRRTAYLSLAFLAVLPYPTWLSVSGHPNPFFMTFGLLGTLLLVTSRGRSAYLLGAAISFCAASTFRYEGLLLGAVFGIWNVGLVLLDRRRWTAKAITAHLLLVLIPFAYIAAWSVSCYQVFGDGFKFFRTVHGFAPKGIAEQGTMARLLWYPRVLWGGTFDPDVENHLSPAIFILGVAGIPFALASWKGKRGIIARYTFVVLVNFGFLVWSAVRGSGNVMAQRVVVLSQVFLVPFAAGVFVIVWDRCCVARLRRRWRAVAVGGCGALAAGATLIMTVELGKTVDFPRRMRGVDPDTVTIAEALHRRFLDHRPDPDDVAAVLVDGRAGPVTYWVLGALGRRFDKTLYLGKHWVEPIRAKLAAEGALLLVSYRQEPPEPLKREKLDQIGKYQLWRVAKGDPASTMSLLEPHFSAK